jgi:DNA-binding MarR family transcriptional regulator
LEHKGLVLRTRHPSDGRAWSVSVTRAGIELGNRATADVERVDRDYFAALGEERATFTRMLGELAAQI